MAPDNTGRGENTGRGSASGRGPARGRGRGKSRSRNNKSRTPKARKKPNFVGLHATVKAVVADEPGLDPLNTQLKRLEDEVTANAQTNMTAYVAASLRSLKAFDFSTSSLMPKPVDPALYTNAGLAGTSATAAVGPTIDAAKKQIYDDLLKSEIGSYVKIKQQHAIYMQQVFGIIEGNLDERVKSLITGDSRYATVQEQADPLLLIKLLREVCSREKGVDYPVASFHTSLLHMLTCKQDTHDNDVIYMEKIKLHYDVLFNQFGNGWLPNELKDAVMKMHPSGAPQGAAWSHDKYSGCTSDEQKKIDGYTVDRLLAYVGVVGHTGKMAGNVSLKTHINNSAAINNNASICYPSNITALLKLTATVTTPSRKDSPVNQDYNDRGKKAEIEKEGTQFAQTGSDTETAPTTASQHLMTAYDGHDGSDLYGHVQFLQTAESWYSDDDDDESIASNTFQDWEMENATEDITTPIPPQPLEHMTTSMSHITLNPRPPVLRPISKIIAAVADAQLRDSRDPWATRIDDKLNMLHIHTAANFQARASCGHINRDLKHLGLTALHPTTIQIVLDRIQGPPYNASITPAMLNTTMAAAAIIGRPGNDWPRALASKLHMISIRTSDQLRSTLDNVNDRLTSIGLPILHQRTIAALEHALQYDSDADSSSTIPDLIARTDPYPDSDDDDSSTASTRLLSKKEEVTGHIINLPVESEEVGPFDAPNKDHKENALPTNTPDDTPSISTYTHSANVQTLLFQFKTSGRILDQSWVLLDSGSTIHLFTNGDLLTNIRKAPNGEKITVNTSAGSLTTCMQGTLAGFGTVWYEPKGIANVLSLGLITLKLRVTMDTSVDNALTVHKTDGSTRRFGLSNTGLYYSNVTDQSGSLLTITTVKEQKAKYSALDVRRATAARKLQGSIGHPSIREFIRIVESNLLTNCGTSRKDILIAEDIFGTNGSILKGKTTTPMSTHLREETIPIPDFIVDNYKDVTLCVDILYVNSVPFVTSVSRHIYFTTAEAVHNARADTLMSSIKGIVALYHKRGLQVTTVIADNQFDCLQEPLAELQPGITYIPLSKGEHEKFVERNIRFIKERCRCMYAEMPYRHIPKRMVMRLVYTTVFWINSFPRGEGVSDTLGPRVIMSGIKPSMSHAKYQFGEYFQTHEESKNNMTERTLDAIYIGPVGNPQGSFYALNLKTGQQIKRLRATTLPVSNTIIEQVHNMARNERAPEGLSFGDRNNKTTIHDLDINENIIDDDASDQDYSHGTDEFEEESLVADSGQESEADEPAPYEPAIQEEDNYYAPIQQDSDEEDEPDIPHQNPPSVTVETVTDDTDSNEEDVDSNEEDVADDSTIDQGDNREDDPVENSETEETTEPDDQETEPDAEPAFDNTRGRRAATRVDVHTGEKFPVFTGGWSGAMAAYEHVEEIRKLTSGHANKSGLIDYIQRDTTLNQDQGIDAYVNHMLLTQYGIKKGLELFEQDGVDAVMKELQQMHDLNVVEPLHPSAVSKEMRQKALNYLMFLKRKRTGTVKGRGCADGRKQKLYVRKEDAAAPTVGTPALFISCLQDAIERRHVATVDVPGAFLQTDQPDDDEVIICFEGPMVELLAQMDPETYKDKIQIVRNGKKILYARAKKAIYGTVRAAYLFWLKLITSLTSWGFVANPYDRCTVNRMFGKYQCTIQWHVDDLKISCRSAGVIDQVISKINKHYGQVAPLTVTRGKVHEYLGMTIDFSQEDVVMFTMYDYINEIIESLPADMQGTSVSPAGDHLFRVNNSCAKLSTAGIDLFHHYTAQLLFLSKRARPDLQTSVAFLTTRVREPDNDDYKKLGRVMKYLQNYPHLPLILGSDGKGNIYWSVDAAFAVHNDMRGHTGAHMSLGQGTVIGISSKQKMNTRSSTEAELVGVDQPLPMILWSRLFSTSQGMKIDDNILYQDNESAIRMAKHGKASCTKRTKHIEIRYFYITDKFKSGEISIEHCPTKEMIGDYFTKPLAGSLFKKFRNIIMGINDGDMGRYKESYKESSKRRKDKEIAIVARKNGADK